jgi:hypothetical protein
VAQAFEKEVVQAESTKAAAAGNDDVQMRTEEGV